MKVPIPVEVPEDEQLRYCEIFRAGYLTMTKGYSYNTNTRDLWPEAYDAGQAQAYRDLNRTVRNR